MCERKKNPRTLHQSNQSETEPINFSIKLRQLFRRATPHQTNSKFSALFSRRSCSSTHVHGLGIPRIIQSLRAVHPHTPPRSTQSTSSHRRRTIATTTGSNGRTGKALLAIRFDFFRIILLHCGATVWLGLADSLWRAIWSTFSLYWRLVCWVKWAQIFAPSSAYIAICTVLAPNVDGKPSVSWGGGQVGGK